MTDTLEKQLRDLQMVWQRRTLENLLPDTATILTRTVSGDAYGGQGEAWTAGDDYPCRIESIGGDVAASYADGENGAATEPGQVYVVTMAYDVEITPDCRVQINGVTYNVVSDIDEMSEHSGIRFLVKAI